MSNSSLPRELSPEETRALPDILTGWRLSETGDAICAEYRFLTFRQAFEFMLAVAFVAEDMGHHPEWVNVYDLVQIRLTTHDVGGLSENDLEMAREIIAVAGRFHGCTSGVSMEA